MQSANLTSMCRHSLPTSFPKLDIDITIKFDYPGTDCGLMLSGPLPPGSNRSGLAPSPEQKDYIYIYIVYRERKEHTTPNKMRRVYCIDIDI